MKKILVTGGSGFIGSNLVNYLIKKKYYVINIDKLTYSSNKYDKSKLPKNQYKFLKFDINNKKKLKILFKSINQYVSLILLQKHMLTDQLTHHKFLLIQIF